MLKKDILLIINPNASKGHGARKARSIGSYFRSLGRQCTIAYTNGEGHARSLAERGAGYGYRTIVAAGGDGTVNEVLNGIMRSGKNKDIMMGLIPIGRGNDFAWAAGIPKDPWKAAKLIANGTAKPCDVGFVLGGDSSDGMYFLNGAGIGFEAIVNFKAADYRRLNGMPSYIAAFLYTIFHVPKAYQVHLEVDDQVFALQTQQISV